MLSFLPEDLEAYVDSNASPEADIFRQLGEETLASTELPQMMVGNVEGTILRLLTRISGARLALEIGTFTGYSGLSIAQGLPEGGRLITCDIDEHATTIARKYWDMSPHGRKISLKLAPALETIGELEEPLDFVFIDADKENYVNYWDACMPRLRPGGMIVADNVLWGGEVLDPKSDESRGIVAFNQRVSGDDRVEHVMLSIRDGMTIAVKK